MEYEMELPSQVSTNYQDSANASRKSWLATTFRDSEEAEEALAADRQGFLQQHDILPLLPRDIKKHINYSGDNGQIKGFEELFVHLERSLAADELRERIVIYFKSSPQLRGHLKNDKDDLV